MEEGYIAFDANLQLKEMNAIAEAFVGRSRADLNTESLMEALPEMLASILTAMRALWFRRCMAPRDWSSEL